MRLALILILALSADQWVADIFSQSPQQEIAMPPYYMYHPESDSLWTAATERERDEAMAADPLVVEIDEDQYQALQAEINLR